MARVRQLHFKRKFLEIVFPAGSRKYTPSHCNFSYHPLVRMFSSIDQVGSGSMYLGSTTHPSLLRPSCSKSRPRSQILRHFIRHNKCFDLMYIILKKIGLTLFEIIQFIRSDIHMGRTQDFFLKCQKMLYCVINVVELRKLLK